MAERVSWLVLFYRVSSEPSRLGAAVWRRLKGLAGCRETRAITAWGGRG